MVTVAETLADFVLDLAAEAAPEAVTAQIVGHIMDTVGVCYGSLTKPYVASVREVVLREGGRPESTGFGLTSRLPAKAAAFYNASLAHGGDFDDTHIVAIVHPTAAVLAPALAIAEQRGLDGSAVVAAVTAGVEVLCRIGVVSGPSMLKRGLHPTSVCGAFGAAAASAKLLGLDRDQTVSAMAMAAGLAGGIHQSVIDGSWNKCIHQGIAAIAGLSAAEFAQAGFTGPVDIFEGRDDGFLASFAGLDPSAADQIIADLGTRWEIDQLVYKVYPCCQGIHPYGDCALELAANPDIMVDQIARIDVRVGEVVGISLCEPVELKYRPPTPYGAKFSIPYLVAAGLIDHKIDESSFDQAKITDASRLALVDKVHYALHPDYGLDAALAGWIQVTLKDGRTIVSETRSCLGTPDNPWPIGEVRKKFMANVSPALGGTKAEALAQAVAQLPLAKDVSDIIALCGPLPLAA